MEPSNVARLDQLGAELRFLAEALKFFADLFGNYFVNLKKAGCSAELARELVISLQDHCMTSEEPE